MSARSLPVTVAENRTTQPSYPLRTTPSPRRADEWALVLTAEGISAGGERGGQGFVVRVPAADGLVNR